jgi:hypothetical protein
MNREHIDTGPSGCPDWLRSVASGLRRALPAAPGHVELGPAVATWEWRIALDGEEVGVIAEAEDGGARLERSDPDSGLWGDALFLVGAEPADLLQLVGGGSDRMFPSDCGSLRMIVRQLAHQLAGSTSGLLRGTREAGPPLPGTLRFKLWLRARALAREEKPPVASLESGLRLRLDDEVSACSVTWLGVPVDLPAPSQLREALAAGLETAARRSPGRPLAPEHRGRLLLAPEAAGWWVHEMGHAALEAAAPVRMPGPRGCRIIDAPALAPWPAGFALDDLGRPARPAVLWDESGCHLPRAFGRHRRPSVRHPATPSLSATRLEADSDRVRPVSFDLNQLPVVDRIGAARFDPSSRCIFLRVLRTGGCDVDGVAVIRADEGWGGLQVSGDGNEGVRDIAACSRQGGLNAVMVGAPTLSLEVEHVSWSSCPPNGGNGAKIAVTSPSRQKGGQGVGGAMGLSTRGGQPWSDVRSEGTKRSRLEEVRAHPGGTTVTRGFEQGSWAPWPRCAPDRPPPGALGEDHPPAARTEAERLREELVTAAPAAWSRRIQATVVRAQVAETDETRGSPAPSERAVASGTVTVLSPAGLGLWSRVALLAGDRWPEGWVEAVVRQLGDVSGPLPGGGVSLPPELRRLPTIVDVFAMADLLRAAAGQWLTDDRRRGTQVTPRQVVIGDVETPGDESGSAIRPVVEGGRLGWGAREARHLRSSWRDLPAPGWSHLQLTFTEVGLRAWPEAVNLVRRIDRVGGITFASGAAFRPAEPPSPWGPVPVPEPAWWLLRLQAPCGPRVPDGTGPPVSVPACLLVEPPV